MSITAPLKCVHQPLAAQVHVATNRSFGICETYIKPVRRTVQLYVEVEWISIECIRNVGVDTFFS
jgi:hypothetical protein